MHQYQTTLCLAMVLRGDKDSMQKPEEGGTGWT